MVLNLQPERKYVALKGSTEMSVRKLEQKRIFFELPYWETLLLRHNLDVMRMKRNVCDKLIRNSLTLMKNQRHY